jgi:hypothetical protein
MTTTTTKKTTTNSRATTAKTVKSVPVSENLPTNPFAFEVFNLVSKQKTDAKKVELLKKYEDPSIKALFIWNFDESLISVLPAGDVPYAAVDEMSSFKGTLSEKISEAVEKMEELGSNSLGSQDQGRSTIRKEWNRFYNFIKGGNDGLSSLRRETMFINLLQGLHPFEAEIICLVKDKKLETKYKISKQNVTDAYSDIQWGNRV